MPTEPQNKPTGPAPSELPDALTALLNVPTYVSGANTLSFRITDYGANYGIGNSVRTSVAAATEVADIRAIAEGLMFDSTKLVSMIEAQQVALEAETAVSDEQMVPIISVMRGGAVLAGGFACVCLVGSALSGSLLLHPLLAAILLVGSLEFFVMSLVSSGSKHV